MSPAGLSDIANVTGNEIFAIRIRERQDRGTHGVLGGNRAQTHRYRRPDIRTAPGTTGFHPSTVRSTLILIAHDIRASVKDIEFTRYDRAAGGDGIFLFLRNVWATIIPALAVPLSIVGTLA